jgi:TonB family protein
MKRSMNFAIFVLMLIFTACIQNVVKEQDENYIPPLVKTQPKIFYPVIAQENSYSGLAKVVVMISKTGTVDRTVVVKSSGYDILDKTAMEYCKELVFFPATKNGEPVDSRVIWEVNYNFMNQRWNSIDYLRSIEKLYNQAVLTVHNDRIDVERNILEKHSEFIKKMTDAINFNSVVEKIISPELKNEWKNNWNSWPLSFLLYHDFIQRFSDYDSMAVVKSKLEDAINYDIQYILKQPTENIESKNEILAKIKKFVADHYPNIILDNAGPKAEVDRKPMS